MSKIYTSFGDIDEVWQQYRRTTNNEDAWSFKEWLKLWYRNGLKVGDKVYYQPHYYEKDKWENGIVKEIVDKESVRVVYHCSNDWENYNEYTGVLTKITDLKLGWKKFDDFNKIFPILITPVQSNLSSRTKTICKRYNIEYLYQIIIHSSYLFRSMRGFGKIANKEFEDMLAFYGLEYNTKFTLEQINKLIGKDINATGYDNVVNYLIYNESHTEYSIRYYIEYQNLFLDYLIRHYIKKDTCKEKYKMRAVLFETMRGIYITLSAANKVK